MRPELQRRFNAIEIQRAALQSAALALGGAPLDWSPEPDIWSGGRSSNTSSLATRASGARRTR